MTLRDLGERRILREVLPEFCPLAGDDCTFLARDLSGIVITTDPAPEPAAKLIGRDADPYWLGWLHVTINASDIAAAGAAPLAFVSALELPPDYELPDLKRLLAGTRECCALHGFTYAGGNLKEATRVSAVGTAIGAAEPRRVLGRGGARAGDVVVSVGECGIFWRDALAAHSGKEVADKARSPLFAPRAQTGPMRALAAQGLITAAIDNSDGLLPSLEQLAISSRVDITVNLENLVPPPDAPAGLDPARLWLGWGDWNVVATMRVGDLASAKRLVAHEGVPVTPIGYCSPGTGSVVLERAGRRSIAPRLESERFAADSWFGTGVDGYIKLIRTVELPSPPTL
ncbi:MAG: thiamine-phosphate kinase [Terriglobales bacterium]